MSVLRFSLCDFIVILISTSKQPLCIDRFFCSSLFLNTVFNVVAVTVYRLHLYAVLCLLAKLCSHENDYRHFQ